MGVNNSTEQSPVSVLCQLTAYVCSYSKLEKHDLDIEEACITLRKNALEVYREESLVRSISTKKNIESKLDSEDLSVSITCIGQAAQLENWIISFRAPEDYDLFSKNFAESLKPTMNRTSFCEICKRSFSMLRTRKNCCKCGRCVCSRCGSKYRALPAFGYHKRVRTCRECNLNFVANNGSFYGNQEGFSCLFNYKSRNRRMLVS